MRTERDHEGEQLTLCGTPNYLAPEVILKHPYGKEADLWSLGCLLYTLLVGKPPFESIDVRDTFTKVKRGDFQIPENINPLARDLIKKLIILDPHERLTLQQTKRHPFLSPPPIPLLISSSAAAKTSAMEPINLKRLRSITQRTRHGTVQITSDGRLLIDFDKFNNVMCIYPCGQRVELYHRPWRDSYATPIETFIYPYLPTKLNQRYEYARRFVNLLRSKSPKVVLITDVFKAFLIDNPVPPWDFQIRYRNGMRVEYFPRNNLITIKSADGRESHYSDAAPVKDARAHLISECLIRYQQCVEAAKNLGDFRNNNDGGPFVINETCGENDYSSNIPDLTVPHLTQLISSASVIVSSGSATGSSPHMASDRSFEYAYKTYLPNIGWCLASPSEQFLLLFVDGQTVLIDGKNNRVSFHDRHIPTSKSAAWHRIDQKLPSPLKQKLSYFPRFVNLLKSGQGHSFVA